MIGRIFQRETRFLRDWPLRRKSLNGWEGKGEPSTPRSWLRLLSNMSTGLDVEKLSLEDSDVSFSELATRCWSDHLYSVVAQCCFGGVSYYCSIADCLMAHFLSVDTDFHAVFIEEIPSSVPAMFEIMKKISKNRYGRDLDEFRFRRYENNLLVVCRKRRSSKAVQSVCLLRIVHS